ncbi:MAG: YibE/F family protein [Galactobacter sp.]
MTDQHRHSHADPGPLTNPGRRRRVNVVLACVLVPVGLALLAAMIGLWPANSSVPKISDAQDSGGAVTATGKVLRVEQHKVCPDGSSMPEGSVEGSGADGASGESGVGCAVPFVASPDDSGQVALTVPPEIADGHPVKAGDKIRFMVFPEDSGVPTGMMVDYDRTVTLVILALVYLAAVILVARWKGVRAIVGLVLAFLVMGFFVFPALAAGESPLAVGLVGCSLIMFVVLYLAHGVSARTSAALIGTVLGLLLTAGLSLVSTNGAGLVGLGDESSYTLHAQLPSVSLSGIVVVGMLIAGLGVLNDVTVTQASAVWELAETDPGLSARALFGRAMRIGRDHIASTVYTIAFAYVGSAFASLMVMSLYGLPVLELLNSSSLAAEVVSILVGSIGLVVAIPLTTAVAVVLVKAGGAGSGSAPEVRASA